MRGREREHREGTEEVFEQLKAAIQPVLDGERERMDILVESKHHYTERFTVDFFPVSGVLEERRKRVFGMLQQELGYSVSLGSEPKIRKLDHYHNERWQQFPTNRPNVVLVRSEIYEVSPDDPEKIIWSIRHLHPKKSKIQKVREKARQIISSLSRSPWPV